MRLPADLAPCGVCGGWKHPAAKCRKRRCSEGVRRWGSDVWIVLANRLQDEVLVDLVVVTAPGADRLPWDRSKCRHPRAEKCSGPKGCRVEAGARDRWERAAQHNWRRLRQACVMRVRRQGYDSPLLLWGDEDQRRGPFHRNVVLRSGPAARAFHAALVELAGEYGFGFVDRNVVSMPGLTAASYLAAYIVSGRGKKQGASMADTAARRPSRHRVWYARHDPCGVTMGGLRNGRVILARRHGADVDTLKLTGRAVLNWKVYDLESGAVLREVWTRTREGGQGRSEAEARRARDSDP